MDGTRIDPAGHGERPEPVDGGRHDRPAGRERRERPRPAPRPAVEEEDEPERPPPEPGRIDVVA
ncbi:MAG TPA: hypothetical protein VKW76_11025 [Candidatus Binatia bacterium]|nr:hypothetical protein [Candidatus Binatia bacterium]